MNLAIAYLVKPPDWYIDYFRSRYFVIISSYIRLDHMMSMALGEKKK